MQKNINISSYEENILDNFKDSLSSKTLMRLLNLGYEDNEDFIKMISCSMTRNSIRVTGMSRAIGCSSSSIKRIFSSMNGKLKRGFRADLLRKMVHYIESQE